jgi:hypothetical protein
MLALILKPATVTTVTVPQPAPQPTLVTPAPPSPPGVTTAPKPVVTNPWARREQIASILRQQFPNAVIHLQGEGYFLPIAGVARDRYGRTYNLILNKNYQVGVKPYVDPLLVTWVEFLQPR